MEPPGTQRRPAQTLLDLRVSKIFRFDEDRRLEILVDVLNVLNKRTPWGVISTNLESPNFGAPRRPIDPRRVGLSI